MKSPVVRVAKIDESDRSIVLMFDAKTGVGYPLEHFPPGAKVGDHYRFNIQKIEPPPERPHGHYVNDGCEGHWEDDPASEVTTHQPDASSQPRPPDPMTDADSYDWVHGRQY
jgi:hypothetical protein